MAGFQVVLNIVDGNAAHAGNSIGKVLVDYFLAQAQRLKDLAACVGLDGGMCHLGGNSYDARQHGFVVIFDGGVVVLVQQPSLMRLPMVSCAR